MADNEIMVLPTTIEHVRLLAMNLRDDDLREVEKWGVTPFKAIWRAYRKSKLCRSGFIGDRIVGIWGVNGSVLGFIGKGWLMTSNVADEYPFVFAMVYRREIREMLKSYRLLEVWCDAAYTKSLKMMRIIGFREREWSPCGKSGALMVRLEIEGI